MDLRMPFSTTMIVEDNSRAKLAWNPFAPLGRPLGFPDLPVLKRLAVGVIGNPGRSRGNGRFIGFGGRRALAL